MKDVKNGYPKTKKISMALISTYQEMDRSKSEYKDKLEIIAMFTDKEDGYKESFNSIEAHKTFKTI